MNYTVDHSRNNSPALLHVPHSSRCIPRDARASILLDQQALERELDLMTDDLTNEIALRASLAVSGLRPSTVINETSRLVVDPERFPDGRETMDLVGMGAVYTRTAHGERLRDEDPQERERLMSRYFHPYSTVVADLVDEMLAATGRAVIIDLHSYPVNALPYEQHPNASRPALCIGTDPNHTPTALVRAVQRRFDYVGEVGLDAPFSGTYVPLRHYERDRRVSSIMLEFRRDLLETNSGDPDDQSIDRLASCVAAILDDISA